MTSLGKRSVDELLRMGTEYKNIHVTCDYSPKNIYNKGEQNDTFYGCHSASIPKMTMDAHSSQLANYGNGDRDRDNAWPQQHGLLLAKARCLTCPKQRPEGLSSFLITDSWHFTSSYMATDLSSLEQMRILNIDFLCCTSCFSSNHISRTCKRVFIFFICHHISDSISTEIKVNGKLLQQQQKTNSLRIQILQEWIWGP